jgi:N-methylhydantoinase A
VGALGMGREAGFPRLMTFDMGGTSTDVALLDDTLPLTTGTVISGFPVKTPMLDIHTVGAGGGSLARLDAGGALAVGPRSAGADPGPLCYGRSKLGADGITVTDANLFLGRLVEDRFLGGAMRLDRAALDAPIKELAARAGLSPVELAEGVLQVADSNMERALRVISVERGHDPREFTLFSFGGAGGLHCASLARQLGMERVLVPANAGILSALGMLLADVVVDDSLTIMRDARDLPPEELDGLFAPLEERALEALRREGRGGSDFAEIRLLRGLDMRYAGQSFELMVELAAGADPAALFEALHERSYGHRNPGAPVQAVNLRLRAVGVRARREPRRAGALTESVPRAARLGGRGVVFSGREERAEVLERAALLPGNRFAGPAVVVEYSTTVVLPPGAEARVDGLGNLVLTVGG